MFSVFRRWFSRKDPQSEKALDADARAQIAQSSGEKWRSEEVPFTEYDAFLDQRIRDEREDAAYLRGLKAGKSEKPQD